MKKALTALFLITTLLGSSSCSPTYLVRKIDPRHLYAKLSANVLTGEKPSQHSQQQLRLLFLEETFEDQPEEAISKLQLRASESKEVELVIAVTELSFLHARRNEKKNLDTALAHYLLAASYAHDFLIGIEQQGLAAKIDPRGPFMTRIYNSSVDRLVILSQKKKLSWEQNLQFQTPTTSFALSVDRDSDNVFQPEYFDRYESSFSIEAEGLNNEYRKPGLGASLVGIRKNELGTESYLPYRVRPAIHSPVNALISFEKKDKWKLPEKRSAKLHFYDLVRLEELSIEENRVPLEADFSTPFAMLLAEAKPGAGAFLAALASDENLDRLEMFMIDRYDPNKIPVVMVHGLFSSPATFIQMFNDLRGVESIRRHYQFWFFRYPTGLPIMFSSAELRKELEEVRLKFDSTGKDLAFRNMVIVGHSMGGLLTKMMVHKPKTTLWDEFATVPPEEFEYGEDALAEKDMFRRMFIYQPLPYVRRVAFIATPHRGSSISSNFIGRLGSYLTSIPKFLAHTTSDVLSRNFDKLKINPSEIISTTPTGIDQLAPESPFLMITAKIPIPETVPYHSVIGIRDADTAEGSSDGVVPYESSHLEKAVSEKLVPAGHSCLDHPYTIAEVKRILDFHQTESRRGSLTDKLVRE